MFLPKYCANCLKFDKKIIIFDVAELLCISKCEQRSVLPTEHRHIIINNFANFFIEF